MSEHKSELAQALAKAQTELQDAANDSTNPHFRSRYASLESVLQEARRVLPKHGLSFTQTFNGLNLVTTLRHISGEIVESNCPLILQKQDMQGFGGAATYSRRYSLAAMLGIGQEDDDGDTASKQNIPHSAPQQAAQTSTVKIESKNWTPSEAQLKRMFAILMKTNVTQEGLRAEIDKRYKKISTRVLSKTEYDEICKWLESQIPPMPMEPPVDPEFDAR